MRAAPIAITGVILKPVKVVGGFRNRNQIQRRHKWQQAHIQADAPDAESGAWNRADQYPKENTHACNTRIVWELRHWKTRDWFAITALITVFYRLKSGLRVKCLTPTTAADSGERRQHGGDNYGRNTI